MFYNWCTLHNTYTLYCRGRSAPQKAAPFRKWYANLAELKSLLHSSIRFAIFTATATRSTKSAVYDMLNLNAFNTYAIEKPPVRGNISYWFGYLNKEIPLESVFGSLIEELKTNGEKTDRCIIFCQARKQCAILYRLFTALLGKRIYAKEHATSDQCLVQMFHAGSPDSVKNHVVKEMTHEKSVLRVLICTIAFGMGIDCKDVCRSIHFGPPNTVESLVQETGRLGRDGLQCFCYILFNGMLSAHCDTQIKEVLETKTCRRNMVAKFFPSASNVQKPEGCMCCDLCSKICDCLQHTEVRILPFKVNHMSVQPPTRHVSEAERSLLYEKLLAYRSTLLPNSTKEFLPVGTTVILHEFDYHHINQVMSKCEHLFTIEDVIGVFGEIRMLKMCI